METNLTVKTALSVTSRLIIADVLRYIVKHKFSFHNLLELSAQLMFLHAGASIADIFPHLRGKKP